MERSKILLSVSCLAALSALCAYAIYHRRKNAYYKYKSVDDKEKPQKKFNRILADNSYSPFIHLCLHRERQEQDQRGGRDSAKVSHPYEDKICFLLDHPPHPLKFSPMKDPLSMDGPYKWIQERSELEVLSQLLSQEHVFAVDTEQHSLRSFHGFTALIQISTQKEDYLLDSIALHDDMDLLQSVFANPNICKVFHGADSDVLWLQRDFHIYVVNLFDTARACDVLGKPQRSLAYLLQMYCGISPNKIFQRADWRLRPLPDEMVQYARVDAHYLLYIVDCLCTELNGIKLGEDASKNICSDSLRLSLFQEAARRSNLITLQLYEKDGMGSGEEAVAASILSRYYSNQGASPCKAREQWLNDGRFEQLVRKLCTWRESVARAEDESLRFVLSDQAIVFLAREIPTSPRRIYSTIAAADSISHTAETYSFMTPLPSPSPIVFVHINNLCDLLREDSINTIYSLQEGNNAGSSARLNVLHARLAKANRNGASKQGSKEASRAQFVRKFSCKSPVYHNCRIYASDGRLLCYCDRRKIDWYICRNLAELIEDDPPAVKLLFEPKGRPEDENNEFYIQSKKNLCVGCGEFNHYLRYRIIPSCYRMHFPEHLKSHRSHDIVLLCVDCHEIAHSAAEKYKRQIATEFGIPLFAKKVIDSGKNERGVNEAEFVADGAERGVSPLQLRTAAMALLCHGSAMPKERREELELVIKTYFGGRDITEADLEAALLVGMGPREKRRFCKKGGLVLKHLKSNSGSWEGNGCPTNLVKTFAKRIPDSEVTGEVSPSVMESQSVHHNEDNQEIETVQTFANRDIEVSFHCIERESEALSNENGCFGGGICDQQKDMVGVIDGGIRSEHQDSSSSSSPKLNQRAGFDYVSEVTVEVMTKVSRTHSQSPKISLLGHGPHGKKVVEKLLEEMGEDGIQEFCQRWRMVFVEAVKPRFLPAGWDIQHSGRREFGEYSIYNLSKRKMLDKTNK